MSTLRSYRKLCFAKRNVFRNPKGRKFHEHVHVGKSKVHALIIVLQTSDWLTIFRSAGAKRRLISGAPKRREWATTTLSRRGRIEHGCKPSVAGHCRVSTRARCEKCITQRIFQEQIQTKCSAPKTQGAKYTMNPIRVNGQRLLCVCLFFVSHRSTYTPSPVTDTGKSNVSCAAGGCLRRDRLELAAPTHPTTSSLRFHRRVRSPHRYRVCIHQDSNGLQWHSW